MGQADDRDLHRLTRRRAVGLRELGREGILIVYVQLHKGDHTDHRHTPAFLQHGDAGIKNGLVPAEFVDDKALEQGLLVRLQQHMGSKQLGKDTAPVNIAGQQHRRSDRFGKPHIDDIVFFQIDLRGAPRTLDDDYVIFRGEGMISLQNHGHQALFIGEIFAGIHVAQDLSADDHLGTRIRRGLEQNGVHPHIRRNAGRLRLHHLGAAHLQSVLRDKGVQRHILGFKGRDTISVLPEDPAQAGSQKALAGVGHGPLDHDCFCHMVSSPKPVSLCMMRYSYGRCFCIARSSVRYPSSILACSKVAISFIRAQEASRI